MQFEACGLVLCGGASERMGTDKCFIDYHGIPQCYHVFELLKNFCNDIFISSNSTLASRFDSRYPIIHDDKLFEKSGPMAALLTTWKKYPRKHLLVVGCDYPLLSASELGDFIVSIKPQLDASVFFNETQNLFEPVLGYYSHRCFDPLQKRFEIGNFSLQGFLKDMQAGRYFPREQDSMLSIDTPEMWRKTNERIYANAGK